MAEKAIESLRAAAAAAGPGDPSAPRFVLVDGGTWILDAPDFVPAVWGAGDQVLWSRGEPCYIVGGSGVGKTTLAAQLVFARLGLIEEVLGLPVEVPESGRVLVLASDRPAQARRAFRRLAEPSQRGFLADRLRVFEGPPPDFARNPNLLLEMCQEAEAHTVVLDSLKDMVIGGLQDEAKAAALNRAIQICITAGIEVLGLHHPTKSGSKSSGAPMLEDGYGCVWIFAGAGSVLDLHGRPGAESVKLHHLKQPASVVGPWDLKHDHKTGRTTRTADRDPVLIIDSASTPLSAKEVAELVHGIDDPTDSQVKTIKRKLDEAAKREDLICEKGSRGGPGGTVPDRYRPNLPPA